MDRGQLLQPRQRDGADFGAFLPEHALDLVERRHDLRVGDHVGFMPLPDEADPQTAHAAREIGAESPLRIGSDKPVQE